MTVYSQKEQWVSGIIIFKLLKLLGDEEIDYM